MSDLGAALADAIEMVARHLASLGRKMCSRHGEMVRPVYKLLREFLAESSADNGPSFQ
jgi:hypothetical protein